MSSAIGLDIGSTAVRAVQLTVGRRGPARLDRLGELPLPAGAMRDGEVAEPDIVAEAVRTLWSRYGFRGRNVALGVANQQVVVRQLDVPYLPEKELRQSLEFQVGDAIPIPVEQAVLDFHVLDTYDNDDGQRFSRILLVAAQRGMVAGVMDVLRIAKLNPILLDLDAFAMLRSLAPEGMPDPDGELLVDVGGEVTNVVVHQAGLPRFVRILLTGGGNEAADDDEETRARRLDARLARLVGEVRGSVDFYAAQVDAVPVTRVVLSGGASQEGDLQERLSDILGLPVVYGHPMQELRIGKPDLGHDQLVEAQPRFAVAVGLALGVGER